MKRYNMVIPTELYNEVEVLANSKQIAVIELLRNFIKLGLLLNKLNDEGAEIIVRQNETDKHILII